MIQKTARAYGVQAIDGPHTAVNDELGFRDVARRSHLLGFDGKWAVRSDQIEICNTTYRPSQDQYERAEEIIEAYRVEQRTTAEAPSCSVAR